MTNSQKLLAAYVQSGSETAFRELVTRHVDLVYSVALRIVEGDAHLAEDVAQMVFADLARMAPTLPNAVLLGGWLHRHTCFLSSKTMRGQRRRQARERQAVEMNAFDQNTEGSFLHVAPILDEAINQLGEPDRTAILLRFFEQHDFRKIGELIGSNEDAARMRVTRALEKLESLLRCRGVTSTAAGLSVLISVNAIEAAPAGLAATLSTAALSGTTLAATTVKGIAMTMMQKTLVTAAIAVLAGAGIYQTHRASRLNEKLQLSQQQQATLNKALTAATNQLAELRGENQHLNYNIAELARLRGEVTRLRSESEKLASYKARKNDPLATHVGRLLENVNRLKQRLQQTPSANIPELDSLTEEDWLYAAKGELNSDTDFRKALSRLRYRAEMHCGHEIAAAVKKFSHANGGQSPTDLSQIKPFLESNISETILERYKIAQADSLPTLTVPGVGGWIVTQKKAVDPEYDTQLGLGPDISSTGSFEETEVVATLMPAIKAYFAAHDRQMPTNPADLLPYATSQDEQAALQTAFKQFEKMSPEKVAGLLQRIRPK